MCVHVCISVCVYIYTRGRGCWWTAQAGAGLGFRSVLGYHYWPPCGFFPWPLGYAFWPLTYPPWLPSEPGRDGRDRVDRIPCGDARAWDRHTNECTHKHRPFAAYFTPTPFVAYSAPQKRQEVRGWRGGLQMIEEKTNWAGGQGWTRKKTLEDSEECPLPMHLPLISNGVCHIRPLIRADKPGLYRWSRFTPLCWLTGPHSQQRRWDNTFMSRYG